MLKKTLFVNGIERRAVFDPECSLLDFLRKQMLLSGAKESHGASTIILNGVATGACGVKMKDVPCDAAITTIEGLGSAKRLHPLQACWILHKAATCAACTPGFIMSAKALLDGKPDPSKEDVAAWFKANGNNCGLMCADAAADAVMDAAKLLGGEASLEDLWLRRTGEPYAPGAELADATAVDIVTGAYETGPDLGLKLPEGALYASLVCPASSEAKIFSVDVSEAEKQPGVFKVITSKDVAGTNRIGAMQKILNDRAVAGAGDAIAAVLGFTGTAAACAAGKVKATVEAQDAGGKSAPDAACCETAQGAACCEAAPDNAKCGSAAASASASAASAGKPERQCRIPAVAFAYQNEKGKLVIHTARTDLNVSALEDGIGIKRGQLAIVNIPCPNSGAFADADSGAGACVDDGAFACTDAYVCAAQKAAPAIEGIAGVAALASGKPVYIEV